VRLAIAAVIGELNAAAELRLSRRLRADPHALMNRAAEIVEHRLAGTVEIAPIDARERHTPSS
jgi:hypothetical protein